MDIYVYVLPREGSLQLRTGSDSWLISGDSVSGHDGERSSQGLGYQT